MGISFDHIAKKFAGRRLLKKKVELEFGATAYRSRLFCGEPAIVARFASQLRQTVISHYAPGTKVLMRGQPADYPGMVPGLFRPPTNSIEPSRLVSAESRLEKQVRRRIKLGRFKKPQLAALLQHYGYRTTWLDVVDNLWTAIWFATNSIEPANTRVRCAARRTSGTGWIYFLVADGRSGGCTAIDLRETHHGLSLRPHAQQGWSVRSCGSNISELNNSVVGCVEFPISGKWAFGGHLGSSEFLFPPRRLDDTLGRLIANEGDVIASGVEDALQLPRKSLGRLYEVRDNAV